MTDFTAPVSVVIPCYLCEDTIERAVLSVLRQTMLPREILLVDDASPDEGATVRELKRLASQYGNLLSIKVIKSLENGGPGSARNRGWEIACQPYVAFLDSDDIWFPQKIECQYIWMLNHSEYVLTCHQHTLLKGRGDSIEGRLDISNVHYDKVFEERLLYFNFIATRTVMLRRHQPHKFMEGKRYSEDYLLWLNIVLSGGRAAKLEPTLAAAFKPDFGVSGLSSRLIKMEIGELDCYFKLYRAKTIGFIKFLGVIGFSLIKFSRRVLLKLGWKLFKPGGTGKFH
jgi:glycosyltransferase involved in cell wall biosynthesis